MPETIARCMEPRKLFRTAFCRIVNQPFAANPMHECHQAPVGDLMND